MNKPDLNRIIDTYVPVNNLDNYFTVLKSEFCPAIRQLQNENLLHWFSFLMNNRDVLKRNVNSSARHIIHTRFEPSKDIEPHEFISKLPKIFIDPKVRPLSKIGGLDSKFLEKEDWSHAWQLIGETSEFVLTLIENHKTETPIDQYMQFLHYITNSLAIGNRCIFMPKGFIRF